MTTHPDDPLPEGAQVLGGWFGTEADGSDAAAPTSAADDPGLFVDDVPEMPEVAPEAGTGIIYITEVADGWHASWQGDVSGYASLDGDREEVIAWARAQPARRRMIAEDGGPHIPLI